MYTYKEKIKEFRKSKKLSQAEFAQKTGVSRSYIAQLELGNKTVTNSFINRIIKEFDLNKHFFYNDDSQENNIELMQGSLKSDNVVNEFVNYDLIINNSQSMIDEMSRTHAQINKYYQRLIDIKLMTNKLSDKEIEDNLTEFTEKLSDKKNQYFNDIVKSKGLGAAYSSLNSIDIRVLDNKERKEYLIKMYHDKDFFEYLFFDNFQKFYNKYMEDWYNNFKN
ncbi:helix-turn-helix domain-containing protein [Chryseobacterium sp. T20]|uniref:helix-turn-helix domain-containing protein n=1 Tax=Chryseobacterium sp. T20 TaxID=3395375 RepID=UPI0039BC54B8